MTCGYRLGVAAEPEVVAVAVSRPKSTEDGTDKMPFSEEVVVVVVVVVVTKAALVVVNAVGRVAAEVEGTVVGADPLIVLLAVEVAALVALVETWLFSEEETPVSVLVALVGAEFELVDEALLPPLPLEVAVKVGSVTLVFWDELGCSDSVGSVGLELVPALGLALGLEDGSVKLMTVSLEAGIVNVLLVKTGTKVLLVIPCS
ncbi:hypothetical protein GGI02_002504 [Coemansia sp. RSA 2322]|nr:hypothetical protein GGI02_002504 [Coemansia sp. RSA 2322]